MKTKFKFIGRVAGVAFMVCAMTLLLLPAGIIGAQEEAVNTLRIYGESDYNAAFPYTTESGPFDLTSYEATDKDFLVWNPAYMYHMDPASNGDYGTFFQSIVVNGNDANEKVHLRQWYVPMYEEPAGNVWVDMDSSEYVTSPDIVKEYTYLLLDTGNDPQLGEPKPNLTSFVFPIADNSEQIGLDSYDAIVGDDFGANETVLNYFWSTSPMGTDDPNGPLKTADLSTNMLTIHTGQTIQFLDHAVKFTSIGEGSAMVTVYYGGNDNDAVTQSKSISTGNTLTAGRHAVHVDTAVDFTDAQTWDFLEPIVEPWYLHLEGAGSGAAFVTAGRLLQYGETFFVDGAEYDVAQLWGQSFGAPSDEYYYDATCALDPEEVDGNVEPWALKYITIRNPLPKVEVAIEPLTIIKQAVDPCPENLPFLPPFNMVHDIIDDVNIPEDSNSYDPDQQGDDNVMDSYIASAYDTITERRVMDQDPVEECWVAETWEPRFDTNLLEEKFWYEQWKWRNIETWPMDFTEFVLPEIDDVTGTGDFILVSSFEAPNSGEFVRVKFCYDAEVGTFNSNDIYVNDYAGYNTLRIYGETDYNAVFPYPDDSYWMVTAPLMIDSSLATDKDFLQWNPAYMYHMDPASNGDYGTFFQSIVVNGNDANEKVHLRQWYVPMYEEPAGNVWVDMDSSEYVTSPDIVKEYTYLLLDTGNDPQLGEPKPNLTSFVFPIADNTEQIGLDSYDAIVGDDFGANETVLNYFWSSDPIQGPGYPKTVDLSTNMLTIHTGQTIQFLDHAVKFTSIGEGSAMVTVYYGGNDNDAVTQSKSISTGNTLTAGRHAVHVDTAVDFTDAQTWDFLEPIVEPWYLHLEGAGSGAAFVTAGRLIQHGETFFVDGAEYDVAQLWGESFSAPTDDWYYSAVVDDPTHISDGDVEPLALEYITIRNPLPKVEVALEPLTIIKQMVNPCPDNLPFLPPFNMVHDIIDDVNIPEDVNSYDPDDMGDDNPAADIADAYDTIVERRVMDQDPVEECWLSETKEPRFDTNLLEEKFTPDEAEDWQWINIETWPWDYTEFVLPEIDDITGTGDYILVSSFLAPNSGSDVRVKFCYDAIDGTGIYVNSTYEEEPPEPVVADAGGPYAGEVDASIAISGSATGGTPPYTYAWDLDYDGMYDDATGQDIFNAWSVAGEYIIGLRVTDAAMATDTDTAVVTVGFDPWSYDEDESGEIEILEVLAAISDYFDSNITIMQVLEVISLYFS